MKPNETTTSNSTGNNTLLAASGLTESFLLGKLEGYIHKRDGYKVESIHYGYYDLLVREFTQLLKMYRAAGVCSGSEQNNMSDGW